MGIGYSRGQPECWKPEKFKGQNLVGEITMQIREEILNDPKYSSEIQEIESELN